MSRLGVDRIIHADSVPFREALRFWLKLGFISFGGPAGQIAIMHEELVERRRWISEGRFLHALNFCMVLPGPEAQQLATYLGWLMHRTLGGVLAGLLFILPSLFILIGLSWMYVAYGNTPLIASLFYGIKPAVTAIVLHAAWRMGSRTVTNGWLAAIAFTSFTATLLGDIPFPLIIFGAAVLGYLGGRLRPGRFAFKTSHGAAIKAQIPALIDDETPRPPHTHFHRRRLILIGVAGLSLWLAPMLIFTGTFGWNHLLTQMGWFFTKAALLTFGGAYAVLPYVFDGAVEQYGWVTTAQMMDGLALGETTPGPLIMIVAFVGFVGGYVSQAISAVSPFWTGAIAAAVVTWFTFLPSFLFILAGGPLVESSRQTPAFTAPLTAITAAVVGVIAHLAIYFGQHLIVPDWRLASVDWMALGITILAAFALFRFKRGVLEVIAGSALIGVLIGLL